MDYLSYKLSNKSSYDLILAFDDNAVAFVAEHRKDLFEGIPIMFGGLNNLEFAREVTQSPQITGVMEDISFQKTLDVILQLQPNATKIYLIVDNVISGQADLERILQVSIPIPYEIIRFGDLT